jgi:hypothetical protein
VIAHFGVTPRSLPHQAPSNLANARICAGLATATGRPDPARAATTTLSKRPCGPGAINKAYVGLLGKPCRVQEWATRGMPRGWPRPLLTHLHPVRSKSERGELSCPTMFFLRVRFEVVLPRCGACLLRRRRLPPRQHRRPTLRAARA